MCLPTCTTSALNSSKTRCAPPSSSTAAWTRRQSKSWWQRAKTMSASKSRIKGAGPRWRSVVVGRTTCTRPHPHRRRWAQFDWFELCVFLNLRDTHSDLDFDVSTYYPSQHPMRHPPWNCLSWLKAIKQRRFLLPRTEPSSIHTHTLRHTLLHPLSGKLT